MQTNAIFFIDWILHCKYTLAYSALQAFSVWRLVVKIHATKGFGGKDIFSHLKHYCLSGWHKAVYTPLFVWGDLAISLLADSLEICQRQWKNFQGTYSAERCWITKRRSDPALVCYTFRKKPWKNAHIYTNTKIIEWEWKIRNHLAPK